MQIDPSPFPRAVLGPTTEPSLAQCVSAELGEIFRPSPGSPPAERPGKILTYVVAGAAGRRERKTARIGTTVAAALAGVAIGAVVIPRAGPDAPPDTALTLSAPKPTQKPLALVIAAQATPPQGPPPVEIMADPRIVEPARTLQATRPPSPPVGKVVKAKASSKASSNPSLNCEDLKGAAQARCAYPAVLAADRRLRQAYASATRAGVSSRTLTRYRNRWADLRHRAGKQPMRVIRVYGDMARDLTRLAENAHT